MRNRPELLVVADTLHMVTVAPAAGLPWCETSPFQIPAFAMGANAIVARQKSNTVRRVGFRNPLFRRIFQSTMEQEGLNDHYKFFHNPDKYKMKVESFPTRQKDQRIEKYDPVDPQRTGR